MYSVHYNSMCQCIYVRTYLTVEGSFGSTTSNDDDSGITSTGVSTIVLAILLSVAIVIIVIGVALIFIRKGSV